MPQEFSGIELEYVTGWIVQIPVVSKKMAQIIFRGIERRVRKIIWFVAAYQRKRCAFAAGPRARYPAAGDFFFKGAVRCTESTGSSSPPVLFTSTHRFEKGQFVY